MSLTLVTIIILLSTKSVKSFEVQSLQQIIKEPSSLYRNISLAKTSCIEVGTSKTCSSRGKCINNACHCEQFDYWDDFVNKTLLYRYSGKYCEECPYCKGQRCKQFIPCMQCKLLYKNATCNAACTFNYTIVDRIERNLENDDKMCEVENEGCYLRFKYYYDSHNIPTAVFEKEIKCFSGLKFMVFTFWGVILYIFILMVIIQKLCVRL